MRVIDTHQHFWEVAETRHKWPDAATDVLSRDFGPGDLLPDLEHVGVDATLLVQSVDTDGETRTILDLANSLDFVAGVVGWIPLRGAAGAQAALDALGSQPMLKGIRHLINKEKDPDWLGRGEVVEAMDVLADRNLVFEAVVLNTRHRLHALTIADRYPNLPLVLDHLANPPVVGGEWEPWAAFVREAAARPNIAIKLSAGLDVVVEWPSWSGDDLQPYVDHVLSCFGADRVMFASNWPVVLLAGSYRRVWAETTRTLAGLSDADRAAVLGGTAARWYRLPTAAPAEE